jgi:hypothetical protein
VESPLFFPRVLEETKKKATLSYAGTAKVQLDNPRSKEWGNASYGPSEFDSSIL